MDNLIFDVSIDKVKILVKNSEKKFQSFLNKHQDNPYISSYNSFKMHACQFNLSVNVQDENNKVNSYYIGFTPNWFTDRKLGVKFMVLEYNPNKIKQSDLLDGLLSLVQSSSNIKYMYVDFAYDINADLKDMILNVRHGLEYTADIGHGGKVETKYFGKFGECGAVRVYNKALEQKIKNKSWTRYEIRIKDISYGNEQDIIDKLKFNDLFLIPKQVTISEIANKDFLILNTLISNSSCINYMDKRNKKKFKEMLAHSLERINLDKTLAINCFRDLCLSYLFSE